MKKLNILFSNRHDEVSSGLAKKNMNSKSEIARSAMSIGLGIVNAARLSMTDREFYNYIIETQDMDSSMDPTYLGGEND